MKMSYSRLSTWQACQQKYDWIYREGLEPAEVSEGLEFGRKFHELMEKGTIVAESDLDMKVTTVVGDYLQTYSHTPEPEDVDRVEKELKLEALWLDASSKEPIYMVGYLDKVVFYEDGRVDIWDYKTAAQFPNTDMLAYRPQANIYWWLLKENFPECTPNNFVWDFVKNKPANKPKILKGGGMSSDVRGVIPASVVRAGYSLDNFSKEKWEEIVDNEANYFKRVVCPFDETVYEKTIHSLKLLSQQLLTIEQINLENKYPVYNIGRDCDWCEYAPLCRLTLSGADTEEYIERAFKKREERNV